MLFKYYVNLLHNSNIYMSIYKTNQIDPCLECGNLLSYEVFDYSVSHYGLPLCRSCQEWIKGMQFQSTNETISLYFQLKIRGVPARLEKNDGYKTIDIAVPEAKVNIEVDGMQHNFDSKQALADLKRTYFSFVKGYFTLRIPNSLIRCHLEETADYITDFLNVNNSKKLVANKKSKWNYY